ncbi:hypothetical protein HDU93_002706, partial [Gonapodya sp. JEL0774]
MFDSAEAEADWFSAQEHMPVQLLAQTPSQGHLFLHAQSVGSMFGSDGLSSTLVWDPLLPAPPTEAPAVLDKEAESRLTEEIEKVFSSLLPTRDSIRRRISFRDKLQRLVDEEWPERGGAVELFGSSTNGLGTHSSDVDVCLLMDLPHGGGKQEGIGFMNDMAEILRRHGMTKIKVIPARVAICKFIDPEFNLACDINLNTRISLRNTELVRSYVAIDPRVRTLCMMVKYWAKRRQLNDAAMGGTLSSYCWVMMAVNYLQLLSPPILPSLQVYRAPDLDPEATNPSTSIVDGVDTTFFTDVEHLQGFGEDNPASAASLLYGFFKKYAVDFDYARDVVSVRTGSVLSKRQKRWDRDADRLCNILCVEEPFNPSRNLANSADRPCVAGIRAEFRRALEVLGLTGSLEACCEPFTGLGTVPLDAGGEPLDRTGEDTWDAEKKHGMDDNIHDERPHPHQPKAGQPLAPHPPHLRSASAPPSPPPYARMTHFTPTYSPSGLLYNRPNARFPALSAAYAAQAQARSYVPVTGPLMYHGQSDESVWYGGYPSILPPGVVAGAHGQAPQVYAVTGSGARERTRHGGNTYYPIG